MSNWTLADADRARAEADARDPIVPGTCRVREPDGTVRWYRMPSDEDEFWAAVDRAERRYGTP